MSATSERKLGAAEEAKLKRCGGDFTECLGLVLTLFEEAVQKQGDKSPVELGTVAALKSGLGLLPAEHQIKSFAGVCVGRWERIHKQDTTVVAAIVQDLFAKIPLVSAGDMVAVLNGSPAEDKMVEGVLECMVVLAEQTIRYGALVPITGLDAKAEAARFRIRL